MKSKIAVIGGGAAGLLAAISAARTDKSAEVTIFERLPRVGKKILATGNGRCNMTNLKLTSDHYHGKDVGFISVALSEFSLSATLDFFHELGLLTKTEDDKVYPYSLQAGAVLDTLRFECENLNVNFICEHEIGSLPRKGGKFIIDSLPYDAVIVACGGKASPHLGSDGSGYKLLTDFGHKLTPLFPAITQIKTETDYVKQLKGIKNDSVVSIESDGKVLRADAGEVLFTDYGLSGPPILQLSRIASTVKNTFIALDLMPEYDAVKLREILINKAKRSGNLEDFLTGILNKRLGQVILKYEGFDLKTSASQLTVKDIEKLCNAIKSFKLKVTGVQGFQNAQVTAGGIETADFDKNTMESKLCENLYAAGEILDIDGDCGGWNLQWAFSSGYLAGKSAALKLGGSND